MRNRDLSPPTPEQVEQALPYLDGAIRQYRGNGNRKLFLTSVHRAAAELGFELAPRAEGKDARAP